MKGLTRIQGRIFNTPLLMDPAKADAIVSAIGPRLDGRRMNFPSGKGGTERIGLKKFGGIAVIEIFGSLVQRSDTLAAASGLLSYPRIGMLLSQAVDDPEVKGIALRIDSPGGEVAGVFDLAEKVKAAAQVKPLWALLDEQGTSAGYLLASAANRIIIPLTGVAGSIAAIGLHRDQSKADAAAGLRYTSIVSGKKKGFGGPHSPLSDEALAYLQERINQVGDLFVAFVAKARGIPEERIKGMEGGVFLGAEAIKAGLADEVAFYSDAIRKFSGIASPPDPKEEKKRNAIRQMMREAGYAQGMKEALAIAKECERAGVPEALAPILIKKLSLKDARGAIRDAVDVRQLCESQGQPELVAHFIAEGVGFNDAVHRLNNDRVKFAPPQEPQVSSPEDKWRAYTSGPKGKRFGE